MPFLEPRSFTLTDETHKHRQTLLTVTFLEKTHQLCPHDRMCALKVTPHQPSPKTSEFFWLGQGFLPNSKRCSTWAPDSLIKRPVPVYEKALQITCITGSRSAYTPGTPRSAPQAPFRGFLSPLLSAFSWAASWFEEFLSCFSSSQSNTSCCQNKDLPQTVQVFFL